MDKQRKLVKWIVIFFAAMLVFTFLSRAADSLNVANVDTKKMQNQVIAHNVKGTGRVEGTKEQAVFVLAGQKVEQVFAKEGQNVKKEIHFLFWIRILYRKPQKKNRWKLTLR